MGRRLGSSRGSSGIFGFSAGPGKGDPQAAHQAAVRKRAAERSAKGPLAPPRNVRAAVASEKSNRCGTTVYVCSECEHTMKVAKSRAFPSFISRRLRCPGCGREIFKVIEERVTKVV
jgi:DNA-directed RNA polymerase subunit RPC12/RpoP